MSLAELETNSPGRPAAVRSASILRSTLQTLAKQHRTAELETNSPGRPAVLNASSLRRVATRDMQLRSNLQTFAKQHGTRQPSKQSVARNTPQRSAPLVFAKPCTAHGTPKQYATRDARMQFALRDISMQPALRHTSMQSALQDAAMQFALQDSSKQSAARDTSIQSALRDISLRGVAPLHRDAATPSTRALLDDPYLSEFPEHARHAVHETLRNLTLEAIRVGPDVTRTDIDEFDDSESRAVFRRFHTHFLRTMRDMKERLDLHGFDVASSWDTFRVRVNEVLTHLSPELIAALASDDTSSTPGMFSGVLSPTEKLSQKYGEHRKTTITHMTEFQPSETNEARVSNSNGVAPSEVKLSQASDRNRKLMSAGDDNIKRVTKSISMSDATMIDGSEQNENPKRLLRSPIRSVGTADIQQRTLANASAICDETRTKEDAGVTSNRRAKKHAKTPARKREHIVKHKSASRVRYVCESAACERRDSRGKRFQRCGYVRCEARYCSRECCKADWKRHRKTCYGRQLAK